MTALEGNLVSGLRRAADFVAIDWVRRQLIELTGIDPHPGTVNLELRDEVNLSVWRAWRDLPGYEIKPGSKDFCGSRCFSVRIAGTVPGAVVLPDVADYPDNKMELVAALPLREHLSLAEGSRIRVERYGELAARAILFDLDGTLVDSVGAYIEVAQIAARPHGIDVKEEHVRRALSTGSNFWKGVMPPDHPDATAVAKLMAAHASQEWPRVLGEFGTVFEGVARTLDVLRESGILLGVVSGARSEVLELLRGAGILDRFEAIILGTDVSRGKPDPEGITICLERLGVAPEEAVYVGDAPVDIQASRAAGVRVIGVLSGAGDSRTLSRCCPDRLIASHAGLPALLGLKL